MLNQSNLTDYPLEQESANPYNRQIFWESPENYWHFEELSNIPAYRNSPFVDSRLEGFRDILITGANVNNEPAEFFAYIGYPEMQVPVGGFPGVLLIHGGGGTAYPQYMRRWMDQGYVVLALDWYNQRPLPPLSNWTESSIERVALEGGKRQLHETIVANIIIAHSLLLSLEDVNPSKTAFVGLSWGSWYGAIVAAVDHRFKGGIEIYCGDVNKRSTSITNGRFHHDIKVPLYWIVSTNDQNVTLTDLDKGFNECANLENKSIVIQLPHSHTGFGFPSCFRMAEFFLKDGPGLPKLGKAKISESTISAEILYQGKGITHTIFCYTEDKQEISPCKRVWKSVPAQFSKRSVQAELPKSVFQCFLSVYDDCSPFNDLCGSTNLVEF